jgi:hypothetical protein
MARALGVHLPLTSPLLLAMGTWLIYVADRILDGLPARASYSLRERHFFYARHRRAFLIAAAPATLMLLWLIVTRMNPEARREDVAVFAAALIYFAVIHVHGPAAERWLPKELTVGVVFAAATAVPAWSRLPASGNAPCRPVLAVMTLFFAALCWLNCVAIEKWEGKWEQNRPHATTLWAQRHVSALAVGLTVSATVAAGAALLWNARAGMVSIFLACAISGAGLLALDHRSEGLSAFTLRIAADAAMLSPILFFAMLR